MMQFENLLGLPLSLARELLDTQTEVEAVVVNSGPPFLARGYTPHWGEERVVRVRLISAGQLEILTARELIGEERVAACDKRGAKTDDKRR